LATILYGVSPIGFGHASRSVAIGLKLRDKSLEPEFATGGPAAKLLSSYGFKVHDLVTEPVPAESGGEMKMAALWYLRYWLGYRSTGKRMAELLTKLSPDLVVGDEEFTSVSLAVQRGIPHAMISDELQLGFARGAVARRVEARVSAWYADLQGRVSNLLVPSFGKDSGNIHYMTPVTREVTQSREAARAEHGLPLDSSLILFSSSGSGIGRFLLRRSTEAFREVCKNSEVFATTGVADRRAGDGRVRELGVVRDNQNLIAAADLVISTAGKSTIDECVSSGTPMIAIPIRNHVEQERNAAELGFSFRDLDRLAELIPKLLGKRTAPAHYAGAQRTADYLESLLSSR
jgi:UDP-N-acetylglucosamine--N-acetylmuramyl-(pentapeptide) pyrophosphoryl-undecaprenol N-acetylglucosamine transferase